MSLVPLEGPQPARGWLEVMQPAIELAKAVASTEFVPRAMRGNPAAISAAILYGDEIGLGPMQSLSRIHVIEGRPTLAAETQRALVLAAGHDLWLEDLTATRCTWAGRRNGRDEITRITWTMDDARRAGLANRQAWRSYPRQMLSARSSAELVRAVFADVVGGLAASEEIEDLDALEPEAVEPAPAKRTRKRRAAAPAVPIGPATLPAEPLPPGPALPGEVEPEPGPAVEPAPEPEPGPARMISDSQRRKLHALMRRAGLESRADRVAYSVSVIGRTLTSSAELTAAECDLVLDQLERDAAQRAVEAAPEPEHAPDQPAPPEQLGLEGD